MSNYSDFNLNENYNIMTPAYNLNTSL